MSWSKRDKVGFTPHICKGNHVEDWEDTTTEEKNYHRREFHYGAFARTITLPTTVQAEQATAQLKDGVLEVTIPKRETTKAKDVPIQT